MDMNNTNLAGTRIDEDRCSVCHGSNSSDILYCCDSCPRVYHPDCYIPDVIDIPEDDWACMMCVTKEDIESISHTIHGNMRMKNGMNEKDRQLCIRLMFEMFSCWPESGTFHYGSTLNFPAYRKRIKDPIALDMIQQKLSLKTSAKFRYHAMPEFVNDVRKMFKNCRAFWEAAPENGMVYIMHADKLEEFFENKLNVWTDFRSFPEPEIVGVEHPEAIYSSPPQKIQQPGRIQFNDFQISNQNLLQENSVSSQSSSSINTAGILNMYEPMNTLLVENNETEAMSQQAMSKPIDPDHQYSKESGQAISSPIFDIRKCDLCGFQTMDEKAFTNHIFIQHGIVEDCVKTNPDVAIDEKVNNDMNNLFSLSDSMFAYTKNLPSTPYEDDNENSFNCFYCEFFSQTKLSLQRHIAAAHCKVKKFECEQCPYTSASKKYLAAHIEKKHSALNQKESESKCFEKENKKKARKASDKTSPVKRAKKTKEIDYGQVEVFCVCRKPATEKMIGCDFCDEWYHTKCLKLKAEEVQNLVTQKWHCPECEKKTVQISDLHDAPPVVDNTTSTNLLHNERRHSSDDGYSSSTEQKEKTILTEAPDTLLNYYTNLVCGVK